VRAESRIAPEDDLFRLVFELYSGQPMDFPIELGRRRMRVRVAGRERTFTVYRAGDQVVAVGRASGISIEVICSRARFARLELDELELAELDRVLDGLREHDA
jgi:hypothetical protein